MANLDRIPAWVIESNYGRGSITTAAAILAIHEGSAAVERETEKAVLVGWSNTELNSGPAGGRFWCPKSLME